ncbi:MAG: DUF3147 family protein [Rhodanobacteraceae bacterium]
MDTAQFTFSFPFTLRDRLRVAFLLPPQSKSGLIAWSVWPLIALCYITYFVANGWRLGADVWWFVVFCLAFTPVVTVVTVLATYAQKRTREPVKVTFSEGGIHTEASSYEFTHRWPAISRVTCSGGFVWLYRGTGNIEAIASLSHGIFWLVLASLPLFLILPALLKSGVGFWPAFAASCVVTVGLYFGLVWVLGRFGVRL